MFIVEGGVSDICETNFSNEANEPQPHQQESPILPSKHHR
jgi:hypothetical protein